MKIDRAHIAFKIIALVLVFAVVTPTFLKLVHGFENHKHQVWDGESTSHLYDADIDCDLCKFKFITQFSYKFEYETTSSFEYFENKIKSQYTFISDYHRLQTSLRGPPNFRQI